MSQTAPLEPLQGYSVAPLQRRGARQSPKFFTGNSENGKAHYKILWQMEIENAKNQKIFPRRSGNERLGDP
ncbi:MAG: hypothetical protein CMO97_02030 [Woeseia sp.]|nr:hypothetical protein [Woeseia sp.]